MTHDEHLAIISSFLKGPVSSTPKGFVNISAMCKRFGKHAGHFLAQRMTKNSIHYWAELEGVSPDQLVVKTPDTKPPTAYAHQRIAFECAMWVSARFRLWYSRKVQKQPGWTLPTLDLLRMLADEVALQAERLARFKRENEPKPDSMTSGTILKVVKEECLLRLVVVDQKHYCTLRISPTNFRIEEGDYISWTTSRANFCSKARPGKEIVFFILGVTNSSNT